MTWHDMIWYDMTSNECKQNGPNGSVITLPQPQYERDICRWKMTCHSIHSFGRQLKIKLLDCLNNFKLSITTKLHAILPHEWKILPEILPHFNTTYYHTTRQRSTHVTRTEVKRFPGFFLFSIFLNRWCSSRASHPHVISRGIIFFIKLKIQHQIRNNKKN